MATALTPGRRYRRLCLLARWPEASDAPRWWPVHGPMHEDAEHIGFSELHYHVDWRFLTAAQRKIATRYAEIPQLYNTPISRVIIARQPKPETDLLSNRPRPDPLQNQYAQIRTRLCHALPWPPSPFQKARWYRALTEAYRDQELKPDLICPHRGADLDGLTPQDGIITCPMHSLQWCVKTGKLHIPQHPASGEHTASCTKPPHK